MTLYALDGVAPVLPASGNCFIAPGARVIGNVTLGEAAGIWFNAAELRRAAEIYRKRQQHYREGLVEV